MANFADLVLGVDSRPMTKGERALKDTTAAAIKTERAVDKTGTAFTKAGGQGKASGALMSASMKKAAIAATALALAVTVGVVGSTKKLIDATVIMEAAQAQLGAAILSTGGAANRSQDQLNKFAAELQGITNFGDEAINSMQGVLLTFTQIKGDELDGATMAVLNMSQALGKDLQSSALQVGKALNDPVKGMAAMAEAGVQFTDSQKAAAAALVATGDVAGAQAIILKELETQFGGSAVAARATLGGALNSLGNAWGDLFEITGPAAESLRLAVEGLIGSITDPRFVAGLQAIGSGLFAIAEFAIQAFAGIAKVIGFITQSSRDLMGLGNTAIQVDAALMGLAGAMEDNITASDLLNTNIRTGTSVSNDRAVASLNELKALQAKAAFGVIAAQTIIRESEAYQEVAASIERSKFALAGLYAAAESGALGENLSVATQQAARMEKALIASIAQQQKLLAETGPVGAAFEQNAQLIRDLTAALAQADGEAINLANTTDDAAIRAKTLKAELAGINFSSAIGGAEALAQRLGVSLSLARQIAAAAGTSNVTSSQVFDPRSPHFNANAQASANREAELARLRKSFEDANAAAADAAASAVKFAKVTGGVAGASNAAAQEVADYASTMQDAAMTMEEMGVAKAQILIGGIDSVSNAFGDWISNGFKDFKGFASSILDTFKNMLSQMIAMAIKNKIMISLGLGGSVAGTAAAAGGAAAGGVGASLGGMGTAFMSGASGLLSGGFAGASAAISGATGALGSFAAAAGAIALPLLAVVGVFTFFKKKTKSLDEGLQGTVKGFDAAIQSFSKTKTTRFWGLSKKISTNVTELDAAQASPLINAMGGIQQSVIAAADTLGVGTSAFNRFSYDFKLSLKGMTDDEKSKAVSAELLKMGDAFASIIPSISSLNELLAVSSERYSLQNRVLELQGKDEELLARVREQQMNATHELNKATLQQVFALEDAAAASQKAADAAADLAANLATIASERLGIQRQIWQLLGDTNSLRKDELSNLDASNRGLQNRLYALQDEKEAADAATKAIQDMIDAISPENFASLFDFRKAQNFALQGVSNSNTAPLMVAGQVKPVSGSAETVVELKKWADEMRAFREEQRQLGIAISANTKSTKDTLRKFDVDGMPAVRT